MVRVLVFCEARADFETTTGLVKRVLQQEGPDWLRDLLEDPALMQYALDWVPDSEGRTFFDVHKLDAHVSRLGVRVPHGHFSGQPGAAGALMARTVFHIARRLMQEGTQFSAVLLVWDMDDQGLQRRKGLDQAREEARPMMPFVIALGRPDPMREAWVLAGFEPETDTERALLEEVRRELGFCPCHEAHRLGAKKESAKNSAKRVLNLLTAGDRDREARCWTEAPLDRLRSRGTGSGLTAFLDEEVKGRLLPLFTQAPTPPFSTR